MQLPVATSLDKLGERKIHNQPNLSPGDTMIVAQGFWSYVHADDQAEGERITRLAKDVVSQFEMLTGESLSLFLDKEAIKWGEDWRDKIDASLSSIAFFVPVMTPRYFMSPECRRELQFFARQSTLLGIKELVLPLYYVNVPALEDEAATDDLVTLVRTFQWEDWRELRFAEPSSAEYRKGVVRLAERIVDANRQMERADITASVAQFESTPGADNEPDEPPGFLDQMAKAEETMPKLVETIQSIGAEITFIGQSMRESTEEVKRGDSQGKGFAARLISAKKLAQRLEEPVENIWTLGNDFSSHLYEIDQGFRVIIARTATEVQENPASKADICSFFGAVRSMANAANDGLGAAQGMIDAIAPIERMSRDLRPVMRRLREGLTRMVEGRKVSDEWVRLIESSGVECDD